MVGRYRLEAIDPVRIAMETDEHKLVLIRLVYSDYDPDKTRIPKISRARDLLSALLQTLLPNHLPLKPIISILSHQETRETTTPMRTNDNYEDEDSHDDEDNDNGVSVGDDMLPGKTYSRKERKSKKKSHGPTKAQCKAATSPRLILHCTRSELTSMPTTPRMTSLTPSPLTMNCTTVFGNEPTFYDGTLEGGVIDPASDKIPREKFAVTTLVAITTQLNMRRARPPMVFTIIDSCSLI